VRTTLCLVAIAFFFQPVFADGVAVTLEKFGLIGTWADDCTKEVSATQPGFRMILTEPPPTHRSIASDGTTKTAVTSVVLAATLINPHQIKLRLRIVSGDRNGGPLPSPTTNTFDEVIEIVGNNDIRRIGLGRQSLERCRD
jgi:hypothetical protein